MTSNDDLQREMGEVETRLDNFERIMERNTKKLDELVTWKNQIDGGKKTVFFAISAAASCGAVVSWVLTHLSWK